MSSPFYGPANELTSYVDAYSKTGDVGILFDQLKALAKRSTPEALIDAAQPFKDIPEVIIPLYERVVAERPNDAQSMVVLANAYWLAGRGGGVTGRLAERAKELDPSNRGAWHLWAITEPDLRKRVDRWFAVTEYFPGDQLAKAALADNATSLANDQQDPVALKLAIATYESLLTEATQPPQRLAIEESLKVLRNWKV